ncbi:saccharopine dehydrogenase C-terminal domain-containing protein [Verrucosispora sp. TAA-831]|uniref:saccharopine dehydrogenase family protein n=1 Tax=Verrucosispora sp. TAA-831 TaxID=3422227 RepID=UPI003D6F3490
MALIPPTGRVHWLGTGMSTGSGLGIVCDLAVETTVWARTEVKAAACLERLGLSGRAHTRAYSAPDLAARLAPGDLVVSMLPSTEHAGILRLCIAGSAHFASSSYVSPEVAALAGEAERAGLVVLTEAGLDPGIDHLFAHRLVDLAERATADAGAVTARFVSYCGSFPAVANDFRYRFAWAPRGVLTALRTPARYIEDGREQRADRPYRTVRDVVLDGESFEVYPNRDSLPYLSTYRFPASWKVDTFVRGTVRLDGWTEAWEPVFAQVEQGDDAQIDRLATQLAERYPATSDDHDRVVMFVMLDVTTADGRTWSGEYTMDVRGDERENATPRLVSVALAGGIGSSSPAWSTTSTRSAATARTGSWEVWRYHKRPVSGRTVYDFEDLLAWEDPTARRIADYATAVLDALEIHNGAGHTEVMLTERGAGPGRVRCPARRRADARTAVPVHRHQPGRQPGRGDRPSGTLHRRGRGRGRDQRLPARRSPALRQPAE